VSPGAAPPDAAIDEDFDAGQVQRAMLNLLEDSAEERSWLEATQRGILNILDDFDIEREKAERAYREVVREMANRRAAEEELRLARDVAEAARAELEQTDIIRQARDAAEAARAELEQSNRELESFSYSVAHDLRAPLRAIDGFARILLEDQADRLDDEGRRVLGVVVGNVGRMGKLLDGLLDFSRLGRSGLTESDVDMDALVRGVEADLLPPGSPTVDLDIGDLGHVDGDPTMLRQVWANLLSNALKFTRDRARPQITIARHDDDAEAVFSIADNGAGFDMQYAPKLFGVFQRLHAATEFDGTGIGLAIVRRIVERHGGRTWAEGEIDHGSTFSFTLPGGGRHGE
jgi:light-regulated signal transduction histidine kinase (bacteriophytochrome)